jgi:hypothetical protein
MSPVPPEVSQLRQSVTTLRSNVQSLRSTMEAASTSAQRTSGAAQLAAARDGLQQVIGEISPGTLVSGIDAHVPLALLPVRIETRFADGADVLHVRVFPDDIHIDGHDPELTQAEHDEGTSLWAAPNDLPAAGETPPSSPPAADAADGRRSRWADLVRRYGGARAAWIATSTRPTEAVDGTVTPGAPALKPGAYIRPPVARALPDRWLARVYAGGAVVGEAWSGPARADLHLAPDPQASPPEKTEGAPRIDDELRWLTEYAKAVSFGMGVDVPLRTGTNRLDRVVVVGVRASAPPAVGAADLAALLRAHRYTDGLGFLVDGSSTSNAPDRRSAMNRQADPDALWNLEFGPAPPAGGAGPRLASALGLPAGALDGTQASATEGDADAQAMQTALWAATWGYYLGELLDSSTLPALDIGAIRSHYLRFVRGRGTLPALRVGRQPYGVLPVVPLGRWTADGAAPTVDGLARLLQRTRPLWQYGVGQPVTANAGPGFDDAFARVMSTDASVRHLAIRTAIADRTVSSVWFTGVDTSSANTVVNQLTAELLGLGSNPFILDIFSPTAEPVRAPFVVDPRDPTPDATVDAAIAGLAATNPLSVLTNLRWLRPAPSGPATVLHTLLRRSVLLEYAGTGIGLGIQAQSVAKGVAAAAGPGVGTAADAVKAVGGGVAAPGLAPSVAATSVLRDATPVSMLVGLTPGPAGGFQTEATLPGVLSSPVSSITGGTASAEWLWRNPFQQPNLRQSLDETLAALKRLATLPAAEIELLLSETLDLATHRWTAWAESVAADKLTRLRAGTGSGVMLGGWAVVERLERSARTAVDVKLSAGIVTEGALFEDVGGGGFVHGPSPAQAATAAVLRAAHLAHGGDNDPTFAVDLSSGPARTALRLAAGIRAGQELGALLGYELERALHERHADVLIAPLRAYAPRWQASGTFVEGEAKEVVSPSAVVDGLALADGDPNAVAAAVLPLVGADAGALGPVLQDELERLRAHQHAVADLFIAETIHHALAGNTARAAGVLDAAHRGGTPPEDFEVLRISRPGSNLTCRMALLLGQSGAEPAGGWPGTPRGDADPLLASWLASVLPPVVAVRLRVADAAGAVTEVALSAGPASLGPLDVVLDRPDVVRTRLALQFGEGSSLVDGRDPGWTPDVVSLSELLTVASDLREVLAARALRVVDLLPVATTRSSADERDVADLLARGVAARTGLASVAAALNAAGTGLAAGASAPALTAARAAIASAMAVGIELHVASPALADLAAALTAGSAEAARRLSVVVPGGGATADEAAAHLKALLGAAQPALPRFALDGSAAAGIATGLQLGDGFLSAQPELVNDWLADLAPVRPPAGRVAAAMQGCEALAGTSGLSGRWRIIETVPAATAWTATADAATLDGLAGGGPVTTVAAWVADGMSIAPSSVVGGLVLDDWTEVVPYAEAATTLVYQADAPGARAPQAVLLGLAPDVSSGWDIDTVVDLVIEAVEQAKLRTVDLETGAWLGRLLPAVLLPDGDASDVIAAPALPLLQVDEAVLVAERQAVKGLG